MTKTMRKSIIILTLCAAVSAATAQVRYTGNVLSDPQRHDGGLAPVIGVHCIQTMRANREHPDSARNMMQWTYNHQPMLAEWKRLCKAPQTATGGVLPKPSFPTTGWA